MADNPFEELDASVPSEPVEERRNGHYGARPSASAEQILVGQENRQGFGPDWILGRELITGSTDPAEYFPRSVIDKKDIPRDLRIIGRLNRKRTGSTQPGHILWCGYQMSVGQDGRGRRDALKTITQGFRDDVMDRIQGRRGMARRANNMENTGEVGR